MPRPVPGDFERVLAVGAHPDDAEFFAGGTLAQLQQTGARVVLVVCSDGARGGRDLADAARVRAQEQAEAARRLGVDEVVTLGFEDGGLDRSVPALRDRLALELRRGRPELVLGHDPRTLWTHLGARVELGHSDHRAAGRALLDAVYPRAASPNFLTDSKLPPWCPRELWLFDTEQADWVMDVSAGWERKLDALRAHASQEAVAGGLLRPAEELAHRFGEGPSPGEAFVRLALW